MTQETKNSILIIGGGLIGLSIAYEFAKNNAASYGVFVIIFSILSGLIAATLFRRL